jgi:hypothetical protein
MMYVEPEQAIPGRVYQAGSKSEQLITFPTADGNKQGLQGGKCVFMTIGDKFVKENPIAGDTFMGIAQNPDAQPPNRTRSAIVANGYVWALASSAIQAGDTLGFSSSGMVAPISSSDFGSDLAKDTNALIAQSDSITLANNDNVVMIFVKPITNIKAMP